jgi:hypothetical protein
MKFCSENAGGTAKQFTLNAFGGRADHRMNVPHRPYARQVAGARTDR